MKRWLKNKNLLIYLLAILTLNLAVQWRLKDPVILQSVQNIVFDSYQRIKPRTIVDTPVRIVDIDEASLRKVGQWPWPRTTISRVIKKLSDMGAAAVALDVVFAEADRTAGSELIRQLAEINWPDRDKLKPLLNALPDNDRILASTIGQAPVVLGFFSLPPSTNKLIPNSMPESKGKYAFGGDDPTILLDEVNNSIAPLEMLQKSASGIGIANPSLQNRDDIIRRVPMFIRDKKTIYPALSIETLRVAQAESTFIIKSSSSSGEVDVGLEAITEAKVGQFAFPLTKNSEFNVYFAPEQPDRYVPAYQVLSANNDNIRHLFDGHIVFIGTSAVGLEDLRTSALGETIPGVSVHAQVIDQILTGTFLSRPDWVMGAEIILAVFSGLLTISILPFAGALLSAVIGGVLASAIVATSWIAFSQQGILIDPVFPTVIALGIFLLTTVLRFAISEREKRFVRSAFQHYLAPDLLDKLERDPASLKLGGEIRDLTLMFVDIRGFTPISEKLSPQDLVAFLNKLLSPLSDIIQKREGAIDKYIGDSIMAFWNAPLDVPDHPRKAAIAALEMLDCLKELNAQDEFEFKSKRYNLGEVEIGIGLNSGEGCVGNMGSSNRFNYSAIGDTVNVAARIESSCKSVGWPLLLSQSTADACDGLAILKVGVVELKGKSEPAMLYALVGDEQFAKTDNFVAHHKLHSQLVDILEKSHWKNGGKEAKVLIARCIKCAPNKYEKLYSQMQASYC